MVNILRSSHALRAGELPWQAVPYLGSSRFAGPTIRHRGSAALRPTGNWRSERPVIDLTKCKRCFLCYLYCPEAAMMDSEHSMLAAALGAAATGVRVFTATSSQGLVYGFEMLYAVAGLRLP